MKISIVTPSYQQAPFLEQTIDSVLSQGVEDLEYIIIDGGSTDGSVDVIKKHEKDLSFWVSEKDNGQSDAINKGLRKATGDIVAWLNSDDLYMPGTLVKVEQLFKNNPDVDLIYGDVMNFHENGTTSKWVVHEFEPIDFLSRCYIHQPSVFWRRSIHDSLGYLDEDLYYQMDYDLWVRVFLGRKTMKVDDVLSKFRIHGEAKTSSNPPGMYLEYRKVFSRVVNSLPDKKWKQLLIDSGMYDNAANISFPVSYPFTEQLLSTVVSNYLYNCAVQEYTFGDNNKARELFNLCISKGHRSVKSIQFIIKTFLGFGGKTLKS